MSTRCAGIAVVAAAGEVEMFRHRVLAAGAQRLATQQPPGRQRAAAPRAKARQRNPCIIRAGGMKAATWSEQWTEPAFVRAQQAQHASGQDIHGAGQLGAGKWYKYSRSKLAGTGHIGYNTRPPRPLHGERIWRNQRVVRARPARRRKARPRRMVRRLRRNRRRPPGSRCHARRPQPSPSRHQRRRPGLPPNRQAKRPASPRRSRQRLSGSRQPTRRSHR